MRYFYVILLALLLLFAGGVLIAVATTFAGATFINFPWWVILLAIFCVAVIFFCIRLIISLLQPKR